MTLQFAAALSTVSDTSQAISEVVHSAREQLGPGVRPDLTLAFVSPHHGPDFAPLAEAICDGLDTEAVLGCTGESIVGGAREIEGRPAIALWTARLPGAQITTMRLEFQRTPEGGTFTGWPDDLSEPWPDGAAMLLLGEPFSFPADELLRRLNEDRPGVPVLGGMASGASSPGENRLFIGRREVDSGAVAALISGSVRVRSVVSQGCRPIGQPFVVTKSEANVIRELGGAPPMVRLQETFDALPPQEQALCRHGLHIGQVLSEYKERFGRGDFLVRNVIGGDPESGAIAVGDFVRTGQTVQFHVRDAGTADEDLRELLAAARKESTAAPCGALLFTCNGRGTRLFPEPDHDAGSVCAILGDIPLAGFFAQGEIGPVGGRNCLHGFTASVAVFEAKG
jgi:small ligand-binding sensory domain FIST